MSMTTDNESWSPDAKRDDETRTECTMRLWAPHAAKPIRQLERVEALRLDREAAEK